MNFGASRALADANARVHVAVAANHNRHMLGLALANRELHRINVRLARDRLGAADSAAAALTQKLRRARGDRRGGQASAGQAPLPPRGRHPGRARPHPRAGPADSGSPAGCSAR